MKYDEKSEQVWGRDFQEFMNSESLEPPKAVTENIFAVVHRDLNPPAMKVFAKLALLHALVGTLTLFLCPQFGVSLSGGIGFMQYFMKLGNHACMLACGIIFMSASLLIASLVLRPEEVRVIRKTRLLSLGTLGLLSLGGFLCLEGTQVIEILALIWLFGTVMGGIIGLALGWRIRFGSPAVTIN